MNTRRRLPRWLPVALLLAAGLAPLLAEVAAPDSVGRVNFFVGSGERFTV